MDEKRDPRDIENLIEKIDEYLALLDLGMRRVALISLKHYIQEKTTEATLEWYSKYPELRKREQTP